MIEFQSARKFYEIIYDVILQQVSSGKIQPGEILTTVETSRAFQVSRTPSQKALLLLAQHGVLRELSGGGFQVVEKKGSSAGTKAHLQVPQKVLDELLQRNWRDRFYSQVEQKVASMLPFGNFQISEVALSDYCKVSRTVAREILSRLERVGLVEQQRNGRWRANQLTRKDIEDHYEMRIILEPAALLKAGPLLSHALLLEKKAHIQKATNLSIRQVTQELLRQLETDLHIDILSKCNNPRLKETIARSQLPLTESHLVFTNPMRPEMVERVLGQHDQVLRALLEENYRGAAENIVVHLKHSALDAIACIRKNSGCPKEFIPVFMNVLS